MEPCPRRAADTTPTIACITHFIKDVYLESQVTVGLLSNVTARASSVRASRAPRNVEEAQRGEILTAAQTAAARDFVNEISGSHAHARHGLLYVGKGTSITSSEQIEQNKPDSWKGYNIANAAKVDNNPRASCGSGGTTTRRWRIPRSS